MRFYGFWRTGLGWAMAAVVLWAWVALSVPATPPGTSAERSPIVASPAPRSGDGLAAASSAPFTTTAPSEAPNAAPPAIPTAVVAFADWLDRWQVGESDLATGVALARARRAEFAAWMERDPAAAYRAAISRARRQGLPAEILAELEAPLAARSLWEVTVSCDHGPEVAHGQPGCRLERTVTTATGEIVRAQTWGTGQQWSSKQDLPASGFSLDGRAVVSPRLLLDLPAPDSRLALPEATTCPITGSAGQLRLRRQVGDEVIAFATPEALATAELYLAEALDNADPTVLRGSVYAYLAARARPTPAADGTATAKANAWTQREWTVLYIRLAFSNTVPTTGNPVAPPGATDLTVLDRLMNEEVNEFFFRNSYETASVRTVFVPVPLRLPQTNTYYAATTDRERELLTDAQALARAYDTANGGTGLYNPDNYSTYIAGFPRVTTLTYAGKARVAGRGIWLNGDFDFATTAHELGHNFGLFHANHWRATDATRTISAQAEGSTFEYGDIFDVMGDGNTPANHFNPYFKDRLSWMPPGSLTTTGTAGVYRVYAFDLPTTGGTRALRVPRGDGSNLWATYRSRSSNRYLDQGGYLLWDVVETDGSRTSNLLDMNPSAGRDMTDAGLLLGRTFSDTGSPVHLTPLAKGEDEIGPYLEFRLNQAVANTAPTASLTFPASVRGGERLTLTASASDPDGDPLFYGWDTGLGTITITNAPSITLLYRNSGTYPVSLEVSDGRGGKTRLSGSIAVTGGIAFAETEPLQVFENARRFGISIGRYGPTSGTASATVGASGQTATSGVDFTVSSQNLSWLSGDGEGRTATVNLLDRPGLQGNRSFIVTLSGSTVATASTPVTILDVDAASGMTGEADTAFAPPGLSGIVNALALAADGRLWVGGSFFPGTGWANRNLAILQPTGPAAVTPSDTVAQVTGSVFALHPQSDGKVLVGGLLSLAGGQESGGLVRFLANGTRDPDWASSPNTSVIVNAIATDATGRVYAWNSGDPVRGLRRYTSSGLLDNSFAAFVPPDGGFVRAMAPLADGKVLVAGDFRVRRANGTFISRVARLNANGTLDESFNPGEGPNAAVSAMAVLPNGRILLAGTFTTFHLFSMPRIARLLPDGALDRSFRAPAITGAVTALAVQPSGRILVAGDFQRIGNLYLPRLARLLEDGAVDPAFSPAGGADQTVNALLWAGDSAYVGGAFSSWDGRSGPGVAKARVVDPAPAGLEGWRRRVFTAGEQADSAISGPLADPNRNGLPNLVEFVLGAEPKDTRAVAPRLSRTLLRLGAPGSEQDYLALSFRRARDLAGVTLRVEYSEDFVSWTSSASDVVQEGTAIDQGDGTDLVVFRAVRPMAPGTRLQALRLAVVGN